MIHHQEINDIDLRVKVRRKKIAFGGNFKLKIYGNLHCSSGKRMKKENRVFFASEKEAIKHNFRPCGHCMKAQYKKWKDGII